MNHCILDDYEKVDKPGILKAGDNVLIWHTVANGNVALKNTIISKVLYAGTPSEQVFLTANTFFTLKRINESTSWVNSVHRKKSN